MPTSCVFAHRRALRAALIAAVLAVAGGAGQARNCALSLGELAVLLRQPGFAPRWQETSMEDGKPLTVTLSEREGELHLQFVKAGEGLWAEGTATVCMNNGVLEALLPGSRIRVGPAANWLLRQSLGSGARFALALQPGGQLRIATPGWNGIFTPTRD